MGVTKRPSLSFLGKAVCHIGVGFLLFIDSKGNAKTSVCK